MVPTKFQRATIISFLLQLLPLLSSAWMTTITPFDSGTYWAYIAPIAYCTAVPPGYCCRPTSIFAGPTLARFQDLPPGSVAAFWQYVGDREDQRDCNSRVLETRSGRSSWLYYPPPLLEISGGSYIQCPAGNVNRGWVQALAGFCMKLRNRSSRELAETDAAIEPMWGYPDIITVNGTNYTDEKRNDLVYRDSAGNKLALKLMH